MPRSSSIDWIAVERDWRAGVLSNREIADRHGTNEANVRQMAKRRGWIKDAAISGEVRTLVVAKLQKQRETDHRASLDGAAEGLADIATDVIHSHRKDIGKMRAIVKELAEELHDQMTDMPEIEEKLMDYFRAKGALNPLQAANYQQQMQRALMTLGLASRSKTVLQLVGSLDRLIQLERQSFKLDEHTGEKTYEESLREVHQITQEKKQSGEARVN